MAEKITIRMTRDSVCAADDLMSHEQTFRLDTPLSVERLLIEAMSKMSLPSISGGTATWVIQGPKPLAIKLQEEPGLKLLANRRLDATGLQQEDGEIHLHFAYKAQKSPASLGFRT